MDAGLKSQANSNGEVPMRMMRVDRQVQSCAPACSRIGARARVGLPPERPGGRSGLMSGGLALGRGSIFGGLYFWKKWQFIIISRKI